MIVAAHSRRWLRRAGFVLENEVTYPAGGVASDSDSQLDREEGEPSRSIGVDR